MPPQPLSSKRRSAKISLDPAALSRHPQLAACIATIVAYWSRIEATLGSMLGAMLGGEARPSIAMYQAILNTQTQMAVLEAAAKVALSPNNLRVLNALIWLCKRAGAHRHKVAHWLWGDSQDLPNRLILVDPDAIREHDKAMSDVAAAFARGEVPVALPKIDLNLAFVWEEKDFTEAIQELLTVYHLALRFSALLLDGGKTENPSIAAQRMQLLASPQIQEALRILEKSNSDGL
ncbi:MAG TPA: hypothetical protein VEI03_11115 [Stellaceae bacterium]|nr:hypothetical protein [Stellaceae bacterium]